MDNEAFDQNKLVVLGIIFLFDLSLIIIFDLSSINKKIKFIYLK
jgi:hypothetical protein